MILKLRFLDSENSIEYLKKIGLLLEGRRSQCLGVIIIASGSEVSGFDPGRGRLIFSERKNPEYDFLRKGSKAMGPVSQIYGT